MGCEICGRNSCTKSFHSIEEQEHFDEIADKIKDRAKEYIAARINKIEGHYHGNNYYIKVDDVIQAIEDYY
jgi:putative component of toxin-antitoxin plasmid stabilization module